MKIEIKIITRDYELGLKLFETRRFPSRYARTVPGDAVVCSQGLMENEESTEWSEIIDLVVEFNEDTSVEKFANWLYGRLKDRTADIYSLTIAGETVEIDEAEIARVTEASLRDLKP